MAPLCHVLEYGPIVLTCTSVTSILLLIFKSYVCVFFKNDQLWWQKKNKLRKGSIFFLSTDRGDEREREKEEAREKQGNKGYRDRKREVGVGELFPRPSLILG